MMSPRPDSPETVAGFAPIFSASHRISEQPYGSKAPQPWMRITILARQIYVAAGSIHACLPRAHAQHTML